MKALSILLFGLFATTAHATLINFGNESPRTLQPGESIQGVQFWDLWAPSGLTIADFGHQSEGLAIASASDSGLNGIRMVFSETYDYLSFEYGNDDPLGGYYWPTDGRALLNLFYDGQLVSQVIGFPNGDDLMNQTIGSVGVLFNEVTFRYSLTHALNSDQGMQMAEVIDNITFDRRSIPEPMSVGLFCLGLAGIALSRKCHPTRLRLG